MVTETNDAAANLAPGAAKIDAGSIALPYRAEVRDQVRILRDSGIDAPLLVGLLANADPAARKYAEWTGRACVADGIRYELRTIGDPIDVESALRDANDDPRVHGIIVYYPIFGQVESFSGESQDDYLRDTVSHRCDVEGLCHQYRSNLYRNVRYVDQPNNTKKCVLPCTALSVVKILESIPTCYDKSRPIGRYMEGRTVTIINRSEIVGRPLAAMLANDGADVYSIDIDSIYLFRGGRLHKCEGETPESCVRKVRRGRPDDIDTLEGDEYGIFRTVVFICCFAHFSPCRMKRNTRCSRTSSSRECRRRTTVCRRSGYSRTPPSSTWHPSRTWTRTRYCRSRGCSTFQWLGR